jgi:hypothetical protein
MELATALLTFYVLALSLQPCGECWAEVAGVFDNDSKTAVTSSSHAPDECVPFCALSCCGVAAGESRPALLISRISTAEPPVPVISRYQSRYTRLHASLIWQPPKA